MANSLALLTVTEMITVFVVNFYILLYFFYDLLIPDIAHLPDFWLVDITVLFSLGIPVMSTTIRLDNCTYVNSFEVL